VFETKGGGGGGGESKEIGRKLELVGNFRGGDVAKCDWL